MSAETIPAELPEGYSVDYGSHRTWMSAFRGRLISGWGDRASAVKACWEHAGVANPADRSTRPAEPAPEVEVGDGEVVAWRWRLKAEFNPPWGPGTWIYNPSPEWMARKEHMVEFDALVRLSTLEAERAKTAAAGVEIDELHVKLENSELAKVFWEDRSAHDLRKVQDLEAALSRALQDREEADERAEAAEVDLGRMIRAQDEALRHVRGHFPGVAAEFEDAYERVLARLRADQRAGEGGGE